jgi:peroxidase
MFVMDRLYDFKKTGTPDQTMDAGLRASLQGSCPPHTVTPQNESGDTIVPMNLLAPHGPFRLDNSFYRSVLAGKAVLQIDRAGVRRHGQAHRRQVRGRAAQVSEAVRQVHGEAGERTRSHRRAGGGQAELPKG